MKTVNGIFCYEARKDLLVETGCGSGFTCVEGQGNAVGIEFLYGIGVGAAGGEHGTAAGQERQQASEHRE